MTFGNLATLRLLCVVLALVIWALVWRGWRRDNPHTPWQWDYEDVVILLLLALILGQ